ncbi:ABC transporter permease [Pollutimonas harenae]|uniref:ABC transporter permease n=1 Tax=Pollutimonas harenae TaxID=657015 RepID=A0A853H2N8_9BURK|nr:ABC transporter permease [Pollutimonas harenae]NYT84424.1 ABC transporter permease [Pollutimonas harenae]TEA73175.1 ABC transporter permease [Pollutimonas harenae]
MKKSSNALVNIGWAVLPFLFLLVFWTALRMTGLINPTLLPSPAEVAQTLWVHLTEGNFIVNVYMSAQRVVLGLLLGMLLAVPVGFLIGWYRPVRRFVDPLINFFRALPPIALIPLAIVYLGIGEVAKVAILFYASFFAAVIVMYEGMIQISPVYIRVARTLGATDFEIFRKVMLPMTVPHMLTALRVALGVAWATLVASELVAAQEGLGAMIQNASAFFDLRTIYLGIISIGVLALLMDIGLRRLSNRLVSWQDKTEN